MPINFVTGLPRQGKTLFTLAFVQERAKREGRKVYYCNIPEVTIPDWEQIDHPDKWMEVQNDSIIVVDELQDFWGMASAGSKVPEPILELSKHGKRGIDFYFITQDPGLVHATPRKLCETHYHVIRVFGTESATVHKFARMQTNPESVKKKSEKLLWKYPSAAYGKKDKAGNWIQKPWYKSADVHNIQRKIPWKVWAIPAALVLAVVAVWGAITMFSKTVDKAKANAGGAASGAQVATPAGAVGGNQAMPVQQAKVMTASEYAASYRPRFEGMPQTAPRYDELTKPKTAPYPAICMRMGNRCECYTQQSTKLSTPREMCLQIVENGLFVDWEQPEGRGRNEAAQQSPPSRSSVEPATAAPPKVEQLAALDVTPGLAARNAQVRSSLVK